MFSETKRVILLRRELKIRTKISIKKGLTGGSEVRSLPAMREPQETVFHPWVGKIPWRMAWRPTPVFLPGESHGQRSLAGYSPQGHRESDTTE